MQRSPAVTADTAAFALESEAAASAGLAAGSAEGERKPHVAEHRPEEMGIVRCGGTVQVSPCAVVAGNVGHCWSGDALAGTGLLY